MSRARLRHSLFTAGQDWEIFILTRLKGTKVQRPTATFQSACCHCYIIHSFLTFSTETSLYYVVSIYIYIEVCRLYTQHTYI